MMTKPGGGLPILVVAAVALFCIALMSDKFSERSYRDDEAWWVHIGWGNGPREVTRLSFANTSPPAFGLALAGWQAIHGHAEATTRFFSGLVTMLTLALTFRLAADLYGYRAGLWAVFLLGTLPIVQYYGYEARNYAILLLGVMGSHLFLLRRLRSHRRLYGVLYVAFGTLVTYTHYFGVYFIIGQAVAALSITRGWRAVRVFGLFVAVGLTFTLGWGAVTIFTFTNPGSGGAPPLYNNSELFIRLWTDFSTSPAIVGGFGLVLALLWPGPDDALQPASLRRGWRKAYLLLVPLGVFAVAYGINELRAHITTRNLLVMLPTLPVLVGAFFAHQTRLLQLLLILILLGPALTDPRPFNRETDFERIIDFIDYDGEPVIIENTLRSRQIPINYYTSERVGVPQSGILNVFRSYEANVQRLPQNFENVIINDDDFETFEAFIGEAERLYYFFTSGTPNAEQIREYMVENYTAAREIKLAYDITLTEYRRVPQVDAPAYAFGETFVLHAWGIPTELTVAPCRRVVLESWWQVGQRPLAEYSMVFAAVDENGQGFAEANGPLANSETTDWWPGRTYLDSRAFTVPCDTPPGEYPMIIGVFDANTLDSLDVIVGGDTVVGTSAFLTTLRVQ